MEESKKYFYDILAKCKAQIEISHFDQEKRIFLESNQSLKDIPSMKNIEVVYQDYSQKELHRKNYKNKNWSENEKKILMFMVIFHSCSSKKQYENFEINDWQNISKIFSSKNAESCRFKCFSLFGPKQTIFPWSAIEDEHLRNLINSKYKNSNKIKWAEISIQMNKYFPNIIRTGKHYRERYLNHLNPNLKKGDWTKEEDILLLEKSLVFGRRWAKIAHQLGNRNENSVKNRFITLTKSMRKKKHKILDLSNKKTIHEIKELINNIKMKISDALIKEEANCSDSTKNYQFLNLNTSPPINEENKNNEFFQLNTNEKPHFLIEEDLHQNLDNTFFSINHKNMNKDCFDDFHHESQNNPSFIYPQNPFDTNNYVKKSHEYHPLFGEEDASDTKHFSSFFKKNVISQTPHLETEFQNLKKELLEFKKNSAKWLDSDDSILSEEDFLPKKKKKESSKCNKNLEFF